MESLEFPGGKRVGVRISRDPRRAVNNAQNLAMLFDVAQLLHSHDTLARYFREYERSERKNQPARDRLKYLNKCYPR